MTFKNYLALIKILIKNQYGIKFGKKTESKPLYPVESNSKKQVNKKLLGIIGAIVLTGIILFYIISISVMLVPAFALNGLLTSLINIVVTAVQLIILFFGTVYMLPYLFFSKDSEFLQSLPLKKSVVFMAKFTMVYINELLISVVILLPFLITVGVVSALNGIFIPIVFYINTLIIIIFSPMLPLAVVSIISYPFIYVINALKNKPLISTVISTLFTIMFFVPVFFLSYGLNSAFSFEVAEKFVINENLKEVLNWFHNYMYPNNVICNSMLLESGIGGYFIALIIYFGFVLGFALLSIFISSFLYGKALSLNIEGAKGKKKSIKKEKELKVSKNPILNLAQYNLKSIFKEPIFAMNILSMPIMNIIVISFFCWVFTRQTGSVSEMGDYFDFNFLTLGMCIYILSLTLSTGNYLAVTPASIEGKNFYLIKTLPISYGDFVKSKLILADGLSTVTVILASVPLWCLGGQNVLNSILFPIVLIFYALGINRFGLYFDFKNPRLNWSNYSEFKKSGLKLWRQMLVGIAVPVISLICCSFLSAVKMHYALKSLIVFLPFVILSAILFFIFNGKVKNDVPVFIKNTE